MEPGPVRTPAPARARAGLVPWLALGVVYLLWSSTYLSIRFVLESVPPLLSGGVRFLVGGVLLAVVVLIVAGPSAFRMSRAAVGTCVLSGVLLPAWGNGLVTVAQQKVASGLAALLIAAVPIYIVVLRAMAGDRPSRRTVFGVAVGLGGLAVLVLARPAAGSAGVAGTAWWGPWLVLLAGLGWAAGTYATTRLPVPPNPFTLAAVQMLVGGATLTGVATLDGETVDLAAVTPASWIAWAYLSVVVSAGAFSAYAYALATLPVSTVSTYAYVNPVLAVALGVVVAGERFSLVQLAGGAAVLAAVVLVILSERRRPRAG